MKKNVLLFIIFAFLLGTQSTFAQSAISIESSSINFSNVNVGTSLQESVMIANKGNGYSLQDFNNWRFSKVIYNGFVHGVGVTPDDCIWINTYGGGANSSIVILDPDGNRITTFANVTVNGVEYDMRADGGSGGRGMSYGPGGKVYLSSSFAVYAIDYQTYQGLARIYLGESVTTACGDEYGNIVVTTVSGPSADGIIAYNSSGNFLGMKIDANNPNLPRISRDLALSPDGKDLFIASSEEEDGYLGTGVSHWHSDNGTSGTYTFVKEIGNYGGGGQEVHFDQYGRLWVGMDGNSNRASRYDCWDLNTMTIVDAIVSPVAGNQPYGEFESQGAFGKPRGFWLSNDGKKAYVTHFERGVLEYENVNGPSITITPNPLNFGNVNVNSSSTQNITIQNNGTANLVISQTTINGTGFTLLGVSVPITIAAGGSRTIAVQFLPTVIGPHSGTITLAHNASGGSTTINLIGNGIQPATPIITITPNSLNFGDVTINTTSIQNITIQNNGTANLVISQTTINGTGFTLLGVSVPITIAAGGSRTIAVQFLPTVIGHHSGTITLVHNASGGSNTINLTGTGIQPATPIITITPNSLNFGDVTINTTSIQNITIQNNGTANLVISQTTINGTGFTLLGVSAPITIAADESRAIAIQFLPTIAGSYTGTITLTHNATGSPTTIPINGKGVGSNIVIDPISINFGEVNIGSSLQRNVRIANSGNVPLVISSFTISSDVFKLTNNETTLTLQPNSNYDIIVHFLPTAPIDYTGSITLTHNGSGSPSSIPLNGKGINQEISVNEPEDIMGDGSTFLFQSSPNPIRSGYDATIRYRLNTTGTINLTVYDVLGREIAEIVNDYKSTGVYSVNFSTKGLPSGVYFYKLRAPGYEGFKKMLIVR